MTRKVRVFALGLIAILGTNGADDLWKDIYDVCTDTIQTSQHELLVGSRELNRFTGDGAGPENKLTVPLILLS